MKMQVRGPVKVGDTVAHICSSAAFPRPDHAIYEAKEHWDSHEGGVYMQLLGTQA